jgi:hypothetical protein
MSTRLRHLRVLPPRMLVRVCVDSLLLTPMSFRTAVCRISINCSLLRALRFHYRTVNYSTPQLASHSARLGCAPSLHSHISAPPLLNSSIRFLEQIDTLTQTIPSINPLPPPANRDSQSRPCRPIWGGPVTLWLSGHSEQPPFNVFLNLPHLCATDLPPRLITVHLILPACSTSLQLLPSMQREYTMLFSPLRHLSMRVRISTHNHCLHHI